MTNAECYEKSFERPADYFNLTMHEQWEVDKRLGILDWEGGCEHLSDSLCKECRDKFTAHYNLSKQAFQECLIKHHLLIARGIGDSEEAVSLREEMNNLYKQLTPSQITEMKELSDTLSNTYEAQPKTTNT